MSTPAKRESRGRFHHWGPCQHLLAEWRPAVGSSAVLSRDLSELAVAVALRLSLERDRGNKYYAPAVERESVGLLAAENVVDSILAGEAANLEIFAEVLAERTVRHRQGRKAN